MSRLCSHDHHVRVDDGLAGAHAGKALFKAAPTAPRKKLCTEGLSGRSSRLFLAQNARIRVDRFAKIASCARTLRVVNWRHGGILRSSLTVCRSALPPDAVLFKHTIRLRSSDMGENYSRATLKLRGLSPRCQIFHIVA